MTTDSTKPSILNPDDWISKPEASRLRGVSRQAIWHLVHRGRLTTCVVAGRIYVSRSEVLNFKRIPRGPAANYPRVKSKPKAGKHKKKKPTHDSSKWISKIEAGHFMRVTHPGVNDLFRKGPLKNLPIADKTVVFRSSRANL